MALSALMMIKVAQQVRQGSKVASFGYPDMIANPEQVQHVLGEKYEKLAYHPDSSGICRRHGMPHRPIPDTYSFFRLLGAEMDVFDIVVERGNEILCDLNQPMEQKEAYDIVLDPGTMEHCFNVSQAAMNMAGLLRKGGVIFHQNPFLAGNHGFYSFNPTWYADFYGQEGWELLDCRICTTGQMWKTPRTDRFRFPDGVECGVFAVARRNEVREFGFPTQTKYRKMHAAINA